VPRGQLLTAIARETGAIEVLFNVKIVQALFNNHEKFRYETRKMCCGLFVEIANSGSADQICKLIGWNSLKEKFLGLVEADDPAIQGERIGALRAVFAKTAQRKASMLAMLRRTFLEIGRLRAIDLMDEENAVIAQRFVQEFAMREEGAVGAPEEALE
jgi:hypothetical protein